MGSDERDDSTPHSTVSYYTCRTFSTGSTGRPCRLMLSSIDDGWASTVIEGRTAGNTASSLTCLIEQTPIHPKRFYGIGIALKPTFQMPKKTKKTSAAMGKNHNSKSWIDVDPARVRFQHSKIRPYFSGCGRSVQETLDQIRRGELSPSDLPPIQVIVGPTDEGGTWYFSLNNRRLWVLKRCREEGFLPKNLIRVRVRQPKSEAEAERYSLENCAVEAKFLREKEPTSGCLGGVNEERAVIDCVQSPATRSTEDTLSFEKVDQSSAINKLPCRKNSNSIEIRDSDGESTSSDNDSDDIVEVANRFSALL